MDGNSKRDPIPTFDSLEEIADFWDNHSTADYDDLTHEVHFEVELPQTRQPIRILPELGERLATLAEMHDVSVETLVNVWLTEKALEAA